MGTAYIDEVSWKEAEKNAKHYLAVGQNSIYLGSRRADYRDYPWHLATLCEPGGSHRIDIATSISFVAKHPSGIEFRWSMDIEEPTANGKGYYEIDVAKIRSVMELLPTSVAEDFRSYISGCIEAVEKKGDEWQQIADRQYNTARQLRRAIAK